MERFSEQTPADLAKNFARNRFAEEIYNSPSFTVAVNTCLNCLHSCPTLIHVPEFDLRDQEGQNVPYLVCDQCADEALEILAQETAVPRKGNGYQGELFIQEVA